MIGKDIILYLLLGVLGFAIGAVTQALDLWQEIVLVGLILGLMVIFKIIITPEEKDKHEDSGIPDKH